VVGIKAYSTLQLGCSHLLEVLGLCLHLNAPAGLCPPSIGQQRIGPVRLAPMCSSHSHCPCVFFSFALTHPFRKMASIKRCVLAFLNRLIFELTPGRSTPWASFECVHWHLGVRALVECTARLLNICPAARGSSTSHPHHRVTMHPA